MRAVFSTVNRSSPTAAGELTYQTLLIPTDKCDIYKIDLKNLIPTVRGKSLKLTEAPTFKNKEVTDFSLEIKLSEQIFNQAEGMDFSFKVFWK
jgi:hypothetical protein